MPTQSASTTLVNASAPGSAETAAATSPFLTDVVEHPGGLLIQGHVNLTPGTGATSATPQVRQGSGTGGTIVGGGNPVTVTAGNPVEIPFYAMDGAPVGGAQYTVTVAQGGAPSAAGAINSALITVDEILAAG